MELLDQYDVLVYVVGEHDEVVAAAGADGETTHVVGVELAYGLYGAVGLVGVVTLLERTPWRDCLMWPGRFSMKTMQYLDALAEVRPGQEA